MGDLITRFAPSPSGPLHLGHAYSALLAYRWAKSVGARFLLRIEDTDFERCRPAYEELIFDDLRWLGMCWEQPVMRQSDRISVYNEIILNMGSRGLVYPCSCTRRDIRAAQSAPQEGTDSGPIYPGTCRHRRFEDRLATDALRLDMQKCLACVDGEGFDEFALRYRGKHSLDVDILVNEIGDMVLGRKENGVISYVLASVIDDAAQGVTDIFRGEDMFEITYAQVVIQKILGLPTPRYHHHKLIRDDKGKRLAKRDDARAISLFRENGMSAQTLILDLV